MQNRCKCGSTDTVIGVFKGIKYSPDRLPCGECAKGVLHCNSCGFELAGQMGDTAAGAFESTVKTLEKFLVLHARGELGDV